MCIFHITCGNKETAEKSEKEKADNNEETDIYRELNQVD
jgi:hypothetical protein